MADGVPVLFPDLYTQTYGVKELDEFPAPMTAQAPSDSHRDKSSKKEKKKKHKRQRLTRDESHTPNSLFRSEKTTCRVSEVTSEFEETKRDLREHVMS